MNDLNPKKEELLMDEEEPVPEEYKEQKFQLNNNRSINNLLPKNNREFSRPNTVISSNPQINCISSISINNNNNNNKKNIITDNNINKTSNNNSITLSRVSKAKTTLSNFDNSKYQNYNIEQMRYNFIRDYSRTNIDKDKDFNFINRMRNDINKRQLKEIEINKYIEQNKVKMDEEERIQAFNRLISDANRRIEAQENVENMKYKLSEDLMAKEKKKYNDEEWKEIYEKRFKNYEENINKKKEEKIKYEQKKKLKEENDKINLFKSKKKPIKLIEESAQRMYDEAKKRKLKMNEKIDRINKYNNEIEDAAKYMKNIKSESYSFLDDDESDDNNEKNNIKNLKNGLKNDYYIGKKNLSNNKQGKIRKKKGMSVSEFNNKRFDKRPQTGKSYDKNNINNHNKMNQIYFNEYMKKNEIFYNLENERDNLLKMFNNNNNNKRYNNNDIKKEDDNKKQNEIDDKNNKEKDKLIMTSTGASNIVEQFFLRQIAGNNI
jgi:hypothetical protein